MTRLQIREVEKRHKRLRKEFEINELHGPRSSIFPEGASTLTWEKNKWEQAPDMEGESGRSSSLFFWGPIHRKENQHFIQFGLNQKAQICRRGCLTQKSNPIILSPRIHSASSQLKKQGQNNTRKAKNSQRFMSLEGDCLPMTKNGRHFYQVRR